MYSDKAMVKANRTLRGSSIAIMLRSWRDVLILSQPKRSLDDYDARKYWLVPFRRTR